MTIPERIRFLTRGLHNLHVQYGWMSLIQLGRKVICKALSTTDIKHTWHILSKLFSAQASALGYADWIKLNEKLDATALAKQREHALTLKLRLKFSVVVPTYNTSSQMLIKFIESVLDQTYPNWELCIADDASSAQHVREILERYAGRDDRIKVAYRTSNGNAAEATNTALAIATGEYICLMDHDDAIAPNALYEFALKLNEDSSVDFIYSDEDKISLDGALRFDPHFKPDWSPEYLECYMYTAHFACYRAEIVRRIHGFCKEFNGAHDYDFVLRFSQHVKNAVHVPKILYHRRTTPEPTATPMINKDSVEDAAIRALEEHIGRTGKLAFVTPSRHKGCFQARQQIEGNPKVSIVIPSAGRNGLIRGKEIDLLVNCIVSIMEKSTYRNLEIVVVDNDDLRSETIDALAKYPIKFTHYTHPEFNIAAKMNLGATRAIGEYLLFLNDDIEVISPDWIEAMLNLAQRHGVGAVGAKLLFEDGTLQHAGVAFRNGLPIHICSGYPGDDPGYFFSSEGQRNYLAVTGACILLRRSLFYEVDGFDEAFAVNHNDIDLCLRVWQKGYRNVYTGQAMLYHFESQSRKRGVTAREQKLFAERWSSQVGRDPYYRPSFRAGSPNSELRYMNNQ